MICLQAFGDYENSDSTIAASSGSISKAAAISSAIDE